MGKVRIVTDSAAHLKARRAKRLGITVVPFDIHFGEEKLRHGVDITTESLFRRFKRSSVPPTTLPPSEKFLGDIYARLHRTTEEIISIHVSGKLSSFCRVARSAATSLLGRCRIVVVDSLTTSLGLGVLVTAAAEAAEQGQTLEEILHLIRGMIPHIYGTFFVETLDYLERDNRIDKAQSILGTMLGIKPFLIIEKGEIIPMEKVQTREEALDKLVDFVAEFSHIERMAIAQSTPYATEETDFLTEQLEMIFPDVKPSVLLYDPLLASHIGPDAMGVVVYEGLS